MRAKNVAGALTLIAFGIGYGYLTTRLPERTLPNTPGPSFLPWILTAALLLLSSLWLIQTLRSQGTEDAPASTPVPGGRFRTAGGFLAFLGYLVALPNLGFLFSTPPLFGLLMWAFGERRPIPLCLFSIAIPLFLYALFKLLFQIPLPASALIE